jgi:hypothetical protein
MAGLLVAKDLLFGVRTISGGVQKNAHDLWPWIFFVEQFFPLLVPSAPRGAIRAGTKLATNVSILEYDLVDIGDNCVIENCVIRPFCLETGHMVLDSIVIGAPGTRLAENSVLGPLSSSHELERLPGSRDCQLVHGGQPGLLYLPEFTRSAVPRVSPKIDN